MADVVTAAILAVTALFIILSNLVVVVVLSRKKYRSVSTTGFILSRAGADLIMGLLVLPITILQLVILPCPVGSICCSAVPLLQSLSVGGSILSLTAIAVERYLSLVRLHRGIGQRTVAKALGVVWAVSLVIASKIIFVELFTPPSTSSGAHTHPLLTINANMDSGDYDLTDLALSSSCNYFFGHDDNTLPVRIVDVVVLYAIPLAVMVVLYAIICRKLWLSSRNTEDRTRRRNNVEKRRLVQMAMAATVSFAVGWSIFYVVQLIHFFVGHHHDGTVDTRDQILRTASVVIAFSNSWVNPLIQVVFSKGFRRSIVEVISCHRKVAPESKLPNIVAGVSEGSVVPDNSKSNPKAIDGSIQVATTSA